MIIVNPTIIIFLFTVILLRISPYQVSLPEQTQHFFLHPIKFNSLHQTEPDEEVFCPALNFMLMESEGFPHQAPRPIPADRVPQFLPGGKTNPEWLRIGGMIK